ncbi:DUF1819 family protein [Paraburkholderia sabiae]|uniref:DUF1819 family protein n=1 Tax=Paraburkholderia sabiae TaxID=273251 RepID=A0ABU9QM15_9BURK|nr:DUF1819 family protein [Paraburkholderia sabiae]
MIKTGAIGQFQGRQPGRAGPRRPSGLIGRFALGLYNAEISAGSLMIPESRRIATLLLSQPSAERWEAALNDENLLQKKPQTAKRQGRLIRNRLETLDTDGVQLVIGGDSELCGQILLAAAMRHSRLLSDFMRDVYAADLRRLERHLNHQQWDGFLSDCENRDEAVVQWAASTREKLFQVIVRILFEAKFLDSTRRRGLTPPLLHPRAKAYLKQLGDMETLERMELLA